METASFWPMMGVYWHMLWLQLVIAVIYMGLGGLIANKLKNAGLIDVFWGFGMIAMVMVPLLLGPGDSLRIYLACGLLILSSLRLGWYLTVRFKKEHPEEDPRYHKFRELWEQENLEKGRDKDYRMNLNFMGLYQLQALLMAFIAAPITWVSINMTHSISWIEWLATGLFFVAWAGEALADQQLADFKANPDNKGKTCKQGLWRYSRHPNYFFEWLMWVAYWVFALATPFGWWTVFAPLLMLYFLLNVTGVKATEERAVQSRDDYREYQQQTSAFVPWFPKA